MIDRFLRPRDRYDPESYRPPLAPKEKLRIVVRFGGAAIAYLWARSRMVDGEHEGAAVTVAVGALIAAGTALELILFRWSRDGDRIFTRTHRQALTGYVAAFVGSLVLVAAGFAAGA